METAEMKDLVIKFLLNEATPDERKFVTEWILLSKENKEEFLETQALVDSILAFKNPHKINSRKAYQQLRRKIGSGKHSAKTRRMPVFLRIASVFLAGFFLSWLLHNLISRPVKKDQLALFQKIEVPYGSKSRLELPDGTKVVLNSGSSLKYPVLFGDKTRDVYLSGEAYFEVKKDPAKPFLVNTSGIHIKVLGTSFNVKSYPEEKTVETTLITGSVEIFSDKNSKDITSHFYLKPSQKAVYVKPEENKMSAKVSAQQSLSKETEQIQIEDEVKPHLSIAWKDNQLEFDNESFHDICIRMERWYNVQISVKNDSVRNARFSGRFDKENVEQAFKALSAVMPFHYRIEKDKIFIY